MKYCCYRGYLSLWRWVFLYFFPLYEPALVLCRFFLGSFFNIYITSCVLAGGCGPLYTVAAISVSVHACSHLTSRPLVSYYLRIGANGCFNAELLGSICPLKFTGNLASSSGPLIPVPVLVSCT